MQLIRRFASAAFAVALESWAWLPDLQGKLPRFASAFGDVFLQSEDGFWFLDTVDGTLTRRWTDGSALQAAINDPATRDVFLMPGLVAAANELGLVPSDTEILSFKVSPVLGGTMDAENLEVADFVVALGISGQLHQQVKDLPPGTQITGVNIESP